MRTWRLGHLVNKAFGGRRICRRTAASHATNLNTKDNGFARATTLERNCAGLPPHGPHLKELLSVSSRVLVVGSRGEFFVAAEHHHALPLLFTSDGINLEADQR